MPAPRVHPDERPSSEIVPTEAYRWRDRIWAYRDGQWRAGVIEFASTYAATVIYRSNSARGTEVDIRTARFVQPREDPEDFIDMLTYA